MSLPARPLYPIRRAELATEQQRFPILLMLYPYGEAIFGN